MSVTTPMQMTPSVPQDESSLVAAKDDGTVNPSKASAAIDTLAAKRFFMRVLSSLFRKQDRVGNDILNLLLVLNLSFRSKKMNVLPTRIDRIATVKSQNFSGYPRRS